jgi:hypothetical protein
MITALRRGLGVRYNPAKIPGDVRLDDADTFIHGIIQGEGGTCASIPVVYVAVGRRLGYPLRLVRAKGPTHGHLFARWDEEGERFNIEATGEGLSCPEDDYYRSGIYVLTEAQERKGLFLRSMTPREELASFLAARGVLCWEWGNRKQAVESMAWASVLVRDNIFYRDALYQMMEEWNASLTEREPPGFPTYYCRRWPPRQFPGLADSLERDIHFLQVRETVLNDPNHRRNWWEPLRHSGPSASTPKVAVVDFLRTHYEVTFQFEEGSALR